MDYNNTRMTDEMSAQSNDRAIDRVSGYIGGRINDAMCIVTPDDYADDASGSQDDKIVPKTCTDCDHYGVCRYEDKLRMLYSAIVEKVSGNKFVDDVIIKCKHHKNASLNITAPTRNIPMYNTQLPCEPNWLYNSSDSVTNPCDINVTVCNNYDDTNTVPPSSSERTLYPKFNTNPEATSTGVNASDFVHMSKDDVVAAINTHIANNTQRDIDPIGVTDDTGEHKSIKTKVLSSGKKKEYVGVNGKLRPVKEKYVIVPGATDNTRVIDTGGVPVKAIDPKDVPKMFQSIITDNTTSEAIPGQTTNV